MKSFSASRAVIVTAAVVASFWVCAPSSSAGTLDPVMSGATAPHMASGVPANLPDTADSRPVYAPSKLTNDGLVHNVVLTTTMAAKLVAADADTGAILWVSDFGNPSCTFNNNGTYPCWTTAGPVLDPSGLYVFTYGLDGTVHKASIWDGADQADGLFPVRVTTKPWDEKASSNLTLITDRAGWHYLEVTMAGYPGNAVLPGDAGDYQGHLVSVGLTGRTVNVFNSICSDVTTLLAPGQCPYTHGGIWARQGVVYSADTDRIYMTSGNGTFDPATHQWGDTVIALHADGTGASPGVPIDSYTPTNQAALDAGDLDLGSSNIVPIPPVQGAALGHVALVTGKDNVLRVLNLDDLSGQHGPGHLGGQLDLSVSIPESVDFVTQLVGWVDPAGNPWLMASNYGNSWAFRITANGAGIPVPAQMWTRPYGKSTPAVANNVMLVIDNGQIVALDAQSGLLLFADVLAGAVHWQSPIVACGRVFIPVQDELQNWSLPGAGCGSAPNNPFGALDLVTAPNGSSIRAAGWALDPDDAPNSTNVLVMVDGVSLHPATASLPRADLLGVFAGVGGSHGYDTTFPAGPGQHQVCVLALDRTGPGGGVGDNQLIGCAFVTVPNSNPIGFLDGAFQPTPGAVTVYGWTIDPDTAAPIKVSVHIDNTDVGWFNASTNRPDIANAYPGYGPNHGYNITVPATPGPHTICTYGINVGPGTSNTFLGCSAM